MENMKRTISELMKKHGPLLLKRTQHYEPQKTIDPETKKKKEYVAIAISKNYFVDETALTKMLFEAASKGLEDILRERSTKGKGAGTPFLKLSKIPEMVRLAQRKMAWKNGYEKRELHPKFRKVIEEMAHGAYRIGYVAPNVRR